MSGVSDAISSIYSYLTGNPSNRHKLVGLGLRMQEEAVRDYVQFTPSGEPSTTWIPSLKEHVVQYTRPFFNLIHRSFRHNFYVQSNSNRYVGIYYQFTNFHGHREQSQIGSIFIISTQKPSSTTRAANEDDSSFFIVKFVPEANIRNAADITIPEFKHIHDTIKVAIRRASHTNEGDIERVEKQIEALEETRPNFPQNLRGLLGSFLAQPSRAEERSFFSGSHHGTRKRVGNVPEVLERIVKPKRGGATRKRNTKKNKKKLR